MVVFLQWNCRGIKNKSIWLKIPPFSFAAVWIFQETFLQSDDILNFPGKRIFRIDRQDKSLGGLIIAVPTYFSVQQIPYKLDQAKDVEILIIKINIDSFSYYLINVYAPKGFKILLIKTFFESLTDPVFLFGNFNLHHPMWGSERISKYSKDFVDWLTDSNFVIFNTTSPTYRTSANKASLIDLTLCSSSLLGNTNCYVLDSSFESDHCPVITEFLHLNPRKRI